MAKGDGLLAVARAKVILPAAGVVWAGAEVAHQAHTAPAPVTVGAAAAAAVTYATRARPLTGTVAAAGVWLTTATAYGPLAGSRWWYPLTITWGAAALTVLWAAHRHPAVQEAKRARAARLALLTEAHALGIRGAHLLSIEETRLGERWELDVTSTGRLASTIASPNSGLAERVAQSRSLPKSRVRVTEGRIAGRVVVSIRQRDPWEHPIPHPLFDDEPELDLPVPCTITRPFPVGQDPETGDPLNVVLWDEIGAKVLMVVGKRGAGKDVLLSNVRERVTAAEDADLWEINVSKAQEERAWRDACEYAACGPEEYKRACQILLAARHLVDERGATQRSGAVFRPTADARLKVLIINEIDALLKMGNPAWVKDQLKYIASKARSEGVALVIAGQRAVAHWIGGTDVRANIDYVAVGKVHDPGEVNHAVGRLIGATLPDMSTYGEGKPGVWCIVDDGGNYQIGRTFELPARGNLDVLRDLARERSPRVPVLAGAGNLPASNLPGGNHSPGTPPHDPGTPGPGGSGSEPPPPDDPLAALDAEMMSHLDPGLRGQLDKIAGKNERTKRILDGTPDVPPGEVDQEALARSADERWRQAADQATIPDDQRAKLLGMLDGDGTTIKEVAAEFKISFHVARTWLEKLRRHDPPLAEVTGIGRARRWVRPKTTGGDDAPCA